MKLFLLILLSSWISNISTANCFENKTSVNNTKLKQNKILGNTFQDSLLKLEKSYKDLNAKHQGDPNLGLKYVELVTSNSIVEKYGYAVEIYNWAFSINNNKYIDDVVSEAKRIVPILEDVEAEVWNHLIEKQSVELVSKIRGYWMKNDPTPSTPENERLIEHWKRITYSRKNFKKNRNSVYDCDERALIYVKYGKPDFEKSGSLTLNGKTSIPAYLRKKTRNFDYSPDFVIWKYYDLNEFEPVIYVFGQTVGIPFKLLKGVEDLIQNSAFNNISGIKIHDFENAPKVLPGGLLQLGYYEQLITVDKYFSRRFDELEVMWQSNSYRPKNATLRTYRSRYLSRDNDYAPRIYAPKSKSEVLDKIKPVFVKSVYSRILDENNNPKLAVIAMSYPGINNSINIQEIIKSGQNSQDYILKHSMISYDKNWNEVKKTTDTIEQGNDNTSIFVIDHNQDIYNLIIYAEAAPKDGSTQEKPQMGKFSIEDVIPLDPDETKLEVSDIISGIPASNLVLNREYTFPVIPSSTIQQGDNIMVYFEVYHLTFGPDGSASFDVEFSLEYTKKRRFRSDKKERLSQKNTFSSTTRTSKEVAGFNINNLVPGEYDFVIEITDKNSNQKKSRSGKFKLVEKK